MTFHVGTSGYSYAEWKGSFYPEDLPNAKMLEYYGKQLGSVEVNNTFYRMPNAGMVGKWGDAVPASFRFSLKAPQKVTHIKRLRNSQPETDYLFKTLKGLGQKLGVVLFQCPPNFRKDADRLKEFLSTLPRDVYSAFEFRHASWFDDEVYEILGSSNAALCLADTDEELEVPLIRTADWGYVRLRRQEYSRRDLERWRKKIGDQGWKTAFVFFKHEEQGVGAKLALQFARLAASGGEKEK